MRHKAVSWRLLLADVSSEAVDHGLQMRSVRLALIFVGLFLLLLSPVSYLYAVHRVAPTEEQAFRSTGTLEELMIKQGSKVSIDIKPDDYGVEYDHGERLILRVSASGDSSVWVDYHTGHVDVAVYPPTGVRLDDQGNVIMSRGPNVPMDITLDEPGPATITFNNSPSDKDISVRYELLVSYRVVGTKNIVYHPYRESNAYLLLALAGFALMPLGAVLSAARTRREPTVAPKRGRRVRQTEVVPVSVFCIECGAKNPRTYEYCGKCGARLETR